MAGLAGSMAYRPARRARFRSAASALTRPGVYARRRSGAARQRPLQHAVVNQRVHVAVGTDAPRRDRRQVSEEHVVGHFTLVIDAQPAHPAQEEVAEDHHVVVQTEVAVRARRIVGLADPHGAPDVRRRLGIFGRVIVLLVGTAVIRRRIDDLVAVAVTRAFLAAPAEVLPGFGDQVHFLVGDEPHVADPEATLAIERATPG